MNRSMKEAGGVVDMGKRMGVMKEVRKADDGLAVALDRLM